MDWNRSKTGAVWFLMLLALVGATALSPSLRGTDAYLPHGVCYRWQPGLIRLHLISDLLIGLAYAAIPFVLLRFTRLRRDLPFDWMFVLFGVFIVACGLTHFMEVWTLWFPDYWLSGSVKAITAAASVPTAFLLFRLMPRALAIPSTEQLTRAKASLEAEVAARLDAEARLREMNRELEARVAARTAELSEANLALERRQRELEEANRQKAEFLAVLSHEIRNPLHAVRSSAHVLQVVREEAARTRAVEVIQRQVGRLSALLEDLLDVVRATRDIPVQIAAVDLREVVANALETSESFFQAKSQRLETTLPSEPVMIHGDAGRLEQALVNLLQNASKFSEPNQAIAIVVEEAHAEVTIRVRDQGAGLDEADMPRMFDLFSQGSANHVNDGMGLGLHIVRQIVTRHGGQVEARSPGRGQGSEFVIRLPRVRPGEAT